MKLLQGHLCCQVLLHLGDDNTNNVFLWKAQHPKEGELVHLHNLILSMRYELVFEVGQVLLPPWENCYHFPQPIIQLKMNFCVLGHWLIVTIHRNPLLQESSLIFSLAVRSLTPTFGMIMF